MFIKNQRLKAISVHSRRIAEAYYHLESWPNQPGFPASFLGATVVVALLVALAPRTST